MSMGSESELCLPYPGLSGRQHGRQKRKLAIAQQLERLTLSGSTAGADRAAAIQEARDRRLRSLLLLAIDTYDSHNGKGPTVPELAADLGSTHDFGHSGLVARLQRELSLGHVSYFRSRFRLTRPGRSFADSATPHRCVSALPDSSAKGERARRRGLTPARPLLPDLLDQGNAADTPAAPEQRTHGGSLVCSVCGYGIARETPPGPCPMCRADDAWVAGSPRPFAPAG